MASGGEDDQIGKRKMTIYHDKPTPRCGHGRKAAVQQREMMPETGRRDQLIQEEENLERAGRTIPPGAYTATPYLEEFDRAYITEYPKEVLMRRHVDTRAHSVINYAGT